MNTRKNIMMSKLLGILALTVSFLTPTFVNAAASYSIELEDAGNSIRDQASLQRGAILFAQKCMACHGAKYIRYNRVARDLGWTDEEVLEKLGKTKNKVVDNMMGGMAPAVAKAAFGTEVPDLSLMSRLKGTDYIYTFLRSFYLNKETGKMDNHLLKGTVMPNVMPMPADEKMLAQYDQDTRDLSNFLEYVGEPAKLERLELAPKVLAFLFVLLILTYLLKKEYWRDIKK